MHKFLGQIQFIELNYTYYYIDTLWDVPMKILIYYIKNKCKSNISLYYYILTNGLLKCLLADGGTS